jgi:hypothetical protein
LPPNNRLVKASTWYSGMRMTSPAGYGLLRI